MSDNTVQNYGGNNVTAPQSAGYITPKVIRILRMLGASRVLDIEAGNKAMCGQLKKAGFDHWLTSVSYTGSCWACGC
jgi:hypothetical protein